VLKIAQVVRRLLLDREVWGLHPELIKSPTNCLRCNLRSVGLVVPQAAKIGTSHSWQPKGY